MGEHNGKANGSRISDPKDPIEISRRKGERVRKAIVNLRGFLAAHTDPEIAALADGDIEFVELGALLCTHVIALQKRCKALEEEVASLKSPKSPIIQTPH